MLTLAQMLNMRRKDMYKLIAVDMDGTLLRKDDTISKRNKETLRKVREKGIKVVIASGRPIHGLERYLEELEFVAEDEYVMSYNGSVVQNIKTKEIIAKNMLKGRDLHRLYDLSKALRIDMHAFSAKGCITPKMNPYSELEGQMNEMPVYEIDYEEVAANEDIIKVMYVGKPEEIDRVIKELPEFLYETYNVVRSMPFFLEFLSKASGKKTGIKILAQRLGVAPHEIMCIGDAGNDVEMLQYAGLGVAMGNAFEEVKQIADYITKTNEEDGVAYAIEKFVGVS